VIKSMKDNKDKMIVSENLLIKRVLKNGLVNS